MKCPIDNSDLVMAERQGIEIDYCPKCRGVWLDRGELDKIIERSAAQEQPRAALDEGRHYAPRENDRYARDDHRPHRDGDRHRGDHRPYKKRKSLLGEIFDFD
ncbi:MAG TPA: zf-TFIIB domain-containing protein [Rhizobiaceae bacterium]|nr:zf-TFIIB domain-containing protein [Rhizobiaceae bacterium]